MSEENPLTQIKDGVSVVTDIMKVAGDIPQVKEAAGNLGQTAVTITKAINNILLPIAAVNFAFEKARIYFDKKFPADLEQAASRIPKEHIVEPKASIAGPTLQGLAFTHEENDLKAMYLNLLATAMDGRVSKRAHPAFVEMIKQLDAEEAKLLASVIRSDHVLPIAQIRKTSADGRYNVLHQHLLNALDDVTHEPEINAAHAVMVDNWIRLGLIEVVYEQWTTAEGAYDWVEPRPEFKMCKEKFTEDGSVVAFTRGTLNRTKLGAQFAESVGLTALTL